MNSGQISNETGLTLDRILRERLEQFDVPQEVRAALRTEIMTFFGRPERNPFGACVMTPEASVAADKERIEKRGDPGNAKPRII
jgi:hypothetical protein